MATVVATPRVRATAVVGLALLLIAFLFSGCADGRRRPPGYFRIGHISGLLGRAQELKDFDLIIRRDEQGLSAMSTQCTYDLSRLALRKTEQGLVLYSPFSQTTYDLEGRVLSGPAKVNLPYYEIQFNAGVYGGPGDTLYVYVGREVSPSWRLPVTAEMLRAAENPPPPESAQPGQP